MFVITGNVNTVAKIQINMEKGYIGLWRKIRDWEWYTDINTKCLFIHLILSVNHCDKNWRGQLIKRGQLTSSYKNLSKATGLSVQEVRTSLDKLILTNDITKESTNKHTTITVINYNIYQDFGSANNKQSTNNQQPNNKQSTTTKELKELKELEKLKERELSHFDFLNSKFNKEIENVKGSYKLPVKEWELCKDSFNELDLKEPTVNRFKKYVHNWQRNLNTNNSDQINNRPDLKRINADETNRMANRHLNEAI